MNWTYLLDAENFLQKLFIFSLGEQITELVQVYHPVLSNYLPDEEEREGEEEGGGEGGGGGRGRRGRGRRGRGGGRGGERRRKGREMRKSGEGKRW